jgi:hypothetical protein
MKPPGARKTFTGVRYYFPRLATHMRENAETAKPTCEQAGDPVGEDDIDLRQPPLAEAHHENAEEGNRDDENEEFGRHRGFGQCY